MGPRFGLDDVERRKILPHSVSKTTSHEPDSGGVGVPVPLRARLFVLCT
jgi:hypothetical protein